ncbi:ISL3 family transposase [Oceanobacillus sojae]|uniref:ISL3 family transposase n=1 Tax=Oceanobacillus sojae TaxID=582851 RepID=UPI0011BF94CD
MHHHFITELLGIKDTHVDVWDIREEENYFIAELFTKQRKQKCPFCGERTKRMHGYRWQSVQGPAFTTKEIHISLRKRRYICTSCHHTFYERLQMIQRYQRCMASVQTTAMMHAAISSFRTAALVTGVTESRVLRWFDQKELTSRKVLPRVIAIDEFKGDADGKRFQLNVVDVENRRIIDILPDRKVETMEEYLKSCDTGKVEIVVMDLSRSFKQAIRKALGNPLIIADRFHFMRQVYWAFDEVRREVQKGLPKKDRIRMKRSKKLLWKSWIACSDNQKKKIQQLLEIDTRLKEAYDLKHALDMWFKESDEYSVAAGLEACLKKLKASTLDGFHRVAGTFKRWRQEILQSFMYPYNNGYIEGVNNTIKVLKRLSYGIKNFERMRKKILWQQEVKLVLK